MSQFRRFWYGHRRLLMTPDEQYRGLIQPLRPPQNVGIISTEDIANFRGWLMQDMVAAGHRVFALAPYREGLPRAIERFGAEFVPIALDRTTLNVLTNTRDVLALAHQLRQYDIGVVLTAFTKPNVIGTLAARRAGVPHIYAMIAGLGYAFSPGAEMARRMIRIMLSTAFRISLRQCNAIFVQNDDDLDLVKSSGWAGPGVPVVKLAGSGIDVRSFPYVEPPHGALRALLIARLIREKGVADYVAAAQIVKSLYPEAVFTLVGPIDSNPSAITAEHIRTWENEGFIEYLGSVNDVRPALANCNVFVLPSYYREGIPRTILEALATGRPVVTTDSPGCRETVVDGHNGFLVPPRAPEALSEALSRFVENPSLVGRMGRASRTIAEARFDVRKVNATILRTMGLARPEPGQFPDRGANLRGCRP